jgi:HK97 gp10 family phage protein
MNLNIRIEGVDNLQRELKDITNIAKLERILELGAVIIEEEAKRYCPVHTGRLMLSITHHKQGTLTQEIVASAPYADYVEYGTFRMTTGTPEDPYIYTSTAGKYPSYRPFLRSAAYSNFNRIIELFDKEMTPE